MKKIISVIVLMLFLTACAKIPDTVRMRESIDETESIYVSESTTEWDMDRTNDTSSDEQTFSSEDNTRSNDESEYDSSEYISSEYDSLEYDSALSDNNEPVFEQAGEEHIERTIGLADDKKLIIAADVDTGNVENVNSYDYIITEVSDETREKIFEVCFGDRAGDAVYDERNDVWELRNSDSVADYYSYSVTFPFSASVESQERITFFNHRPDLNPFEYNRLDNADESCCRLNIDDAVKMCDELVENVEAFHGMKTDFIHAYGKDGRTPYYRLMYKRVIDGMVVNGYDDIFILVDDDGIEKLSGAVYEVSDSDKNISIITVDEAVDKLEENAGYISTVDDLYVTQITLEYCAVKRAAGRVAVVPVWRFCLGASKNERNLLRTNILAVNAVTGELINEIRGDIFE